MSAMEPLIYLGIDAGGTYTDAVLFSPKRGAIAKSKALTTYHDLSIGITEAVDKALQSAGVAPGAIALVSVSTTLATNALVEGKTAPAALILIGFDHAVLKNKNLAAAIGAAPVIFCPGGHDGFGEEASPLDLSALEARLPELRNSVAGVAICGHFAVRNPGHELATQRMLIEQAGLSTTMSHVLSSSLGGPKRAVTALLNAGLVPRIARLLTACESYLQRSGINAPLMVVRGDGSLVSAQFARVNPIETILSGPAAGVVGAQYLCGLSDAVVSDIGGTTTDVTVIENGRPRIDSQGATVGGVRTMVQAVASSTFGLGGDSEITFQADSGETSLTVGPRRLIPLSLLAMQFGSPVLAELERQARKDRISEFDGRFAIRSALGLISGLSDKDQAFLSRISDGAAPLDVLVTRGADRSALRRLIDGGIVMISGFTPSDAAHVLGKQFTWSLRAAELGAQILCRQRNNFGTPLASSANEIATRVLASLTRASAEAIYKTAFAIGDTDGAAIVGSPAFQRALNVDSGLVKMSARLAHPVIGLGASAGLHYESLPKLIGNRCEISPDADVANAIGAVVGQIAITMSAYVQSPNETLFRVTAGSKTTDYSSLEVALEGAERDIRTEVNARALAAGAFQPDVAVTRAIKMVMVEGRETFIDAAVQAVATGRPKLTQDDPLSIDCIGPTFPK